MGVITWKYVRSGEGVPWKCTSGREGFQKLTKLSVRTVEWPRILLRVMYVLIVICNSEFIFVERKQSQISIQYMWDASSKRKRKRRFQEEHYVIQKWNFSYLLYLLQFRIENLASHYFKSFDSSCDEFHIKRHASIEFRPRTYCRVVHLLEIPLNISFTLWCDNSSAYHKSSVRFVFQT